MMRLALIFSVLLLSPSLSFAGANSFAEITGVEPSVRANGMADAYASADGDPYGVYYNPAQSAREKTAALYFQRGYADDSTGALAFSLPDAFAGFSLGLSYLYYNTGDLDLFTSAGDKRTVTGEKDYVAAFSLSRRLGRYSLGANLKLLHMSLFESASDSTGLLDLGFLADYPFARLGFSVQNIGGKMQLGTEEEKIPSNWRLGASRVFKAGDVDITGAFDVVKRENEPAYLRAGAEFLYNRMVALRTGYEFKNSLAEDNTLRFGCGFILQNMSLDYALVPYQDLGATHRFSLAYRFGGPAASGAVPTERSEGNHAAALQQDEPARAEAGVPAEAAAPAGPEAVSVGSSQPEQGPQAELPVPAPSEQTAVKDESTASPGTGSPL